MKKIKYIMMLLFTVGFISSCEKDLETDNVSKVTYYPEIKINGAPVMFVVAGTSYTEPGVKSFENGVEIPTSISVTSDYFNSGKTIDVNKPDKYIVTYKASNKDSFDGFKERIVYVVATGDLVNSIEGLYTSTVVRNTVSDPQYTDMAYVMIKKTGDNTFEITDAIGGYYDLGRGYGAAYRTPDVTITKNGNAYSATPDFTIGTFGGVANMSSISVDPIAKTISFVTDWDAGYTFEITLTQVEL